MMGKLIVEFLDNHRDQPVNKYMDLQVTNSINMVDQVRLFQSRVTKYRFLLNTSLTCGWSR